MSKVSVISLRNQRNTLWERTKDFLEAHRDENGLVSAEFVDQYNKMISDVQALGDEITRLEEQMEMDAKLSAPTSVPVQEKPTAQKKATSPTATEEYAEAFWNSMRGDNSFEVRNALSIGTDANGGFTVPDEFHRQLIRTLEENNVFRRIAKVITTQSGVRTIPIAGEYGSASWVEEGNAISESDMTFTVQTLSAYKLGSLIRVSAELLHDSAFDIASYIAERFGQRFGNAEEEAFIHGTGPSSDPAVPSQPTGILNCLTTPAVTSAGAEVITFDDLFKLYYSLKAPYRGKASFLCNEATLLQLMMLKDGNGNYLWKPSLDVAKPDTILGHNIVTSTHMPSFSGNAAEDAGKKVLLFGDFSNYWIADRTNRTLRRLDELYAVNDQVGFVGTQRVDGKLILNEAMQVLALGAAG